MRLSKPSQHGSAQFLRLVGSTKNCRSRYFKFSLGHAILAACRPDHRGFATAFSVFNDNAVDNVMAFLRRGLDLIEQHHEAIDSFFPDRKPSKCGPHESNLPPKAARYFVHKRFAVEAVVKNFYDAIQANPKMTP